MKYRTIADNIMHFLMHNSFMFTVAIMCLVHATLLGVSWYAGVMPLVYVNFVSVIVYLFCIILSNFGHIIPVYISILAEVTIYSVISVYYIGWKCGAQFFLISIVPIIIYFGCFILKGAKRWIVAGVLIFNFSIFIYLFVDYYNATPVYNVSYTVSAALMVFTSFVMVFSVVFYNVIYIYSSEYEKIDLEKKNEKLTVDAEEDALTGLLNRRGFLPIVEALMNGETRSNFCVAFCDIDNFKRVNDSYGHDCGDEVLRHIAKLIKREMTNCNICRWGGEEMVILMKDYDFEVAKQKMEYLRKCIESTPTIFYNKRIAATITIGIEEYKETHKEPEEVIKVADGRMYYGKQHGKNVVIFEDYE